MFMKFALLAVTFSVSAVSASSCMLVGMANLVSVAQANGSSVTPLTFGPATDNEGNPVLQVASSAPSSPTNQIYVCSNTESAPIIGYVADSATSTQCLTASTLNATTTIYQSSCVPGAANQNFQFYGAPYFFPLVFLGSQTGPATGNTDYAASINSDNVLELTYSPGAVAAPTDQNTPYFSLQFSS